MSVGFGFDVVVAVLILATGIWIVSARAGFTAVVVFVVYGLLLALAWVRLSAVDVALTEAAIGSGVTGMLLLDAATRLRKTETTSTTLSLPMRILTGVLCAAITAGLAYIMLSPPAVAPTLAPPVQANLTQTGLGNAVAGVLFAYRAFDTLLEKVVLLLALIGVWSLARDRAWGGRPGLRLYTPPGNILAFLDQLLPPIGIMFGIYMFWVGADKPGGAFQGGTVLAAMWLLVMIAGLQEVPAIGRRWLRLLLVVGPVIFLIIGFAGFAVAGSFLAYPANYAKLLIVIIEVVFTLSIGVTLGLLAAGPPERVQQ